MARTDDPRCHTVVFDVNVYLDVAELVECPFSWRKFHDAASQHKAALLCGPDRRIDSLRAIALATTARFAGPHPLQVWTSKHIDGLTATKAAQPLVADDSEGRGLGWSHDHAIDLVDDLIWSLVFDMSGGGCLDVDIAYGSPPLSHEDGLVYRTAEACGDHNMNRYCVTNDKEFRLAALPGDITVLYPHEWISLVRQSRFLFSAPHPRPLP